MSSHLSLILAAGAWHTEFHVQPIVPYLEKYGYRVVPVKLWTSSEHDPPPTVEDNVQKILQAAKAEVAAGRDICMVGHSASGMSVSAAMSEFLRTGSATEKAKLVRGIFIACFWNPVRTFEGQNWYEINFETLWVEIIKHAADIFYNNMPAAEAKKFVDALEKNRLHMPPETPDNWKTEVKCTYFVCEKDQAVPPKFQKVEAEENGMDIVHVDMDHCPFISTPEDFAQRMHEVLKG